MIINTYDLETVSVRNLSFKIAGISPYLGDI